MERCDAIVVGGGPAGSACARRLHEAGRDVLVLDKAAFPRDKTCAGWITPEVLALTRLDPQEYARSRTIQAVYGFRIGEIGRPASEIRYAQPVSYGIRRCEFDHYLLEQSGARRELGQAVRSLQRAGADWRVNDRYEAPLLVGAGGHFCPVAERLGARPGAGRVVVAQEVEIEMSDAQARACCVEADLPELYFCAGLLGYGWCFRKGNFLNVGLGREDADGLGDHVRAFVDVLHEHGRIPTDMHARFRGHAYSLYGHNRRQRVDDGVLLVGDAAGMAYSPSGEGIRTAIESGVLAAETIIAADGDYRRQRLADYEQRLVQRFGSAEPQRNWLESLPDRLRFALGRWFFTVPWFARRVVLEKWFLHARPAHGRATALQSA